MAGKKAEHFAMAWLAFGEAVRGSGKARNIAMPIGLASGNYPSARPSAEQFSYPLSFEGLLGSIFQA
jgi:hypothetical protein